MQLAYPQNDTRAETLRYLGAGGWQPDAASQVLLQKAEDALRAAATPRGVWKQLPLTALPLQNAGNDIARHLRGCDAMVLMALTLGSGADTLMRRLELTEAHKPEILMVGDRKFDVLGAKACGIACAGVEFFGYAAPGELAESGAVAVVRTPEELEQFILTH